MNGRRDSAGKEKIVRTALVPPSAIFFATLALSCTAHTDPCLLAAAGVAGSDRDRMSVPIMVHSSTTSSLSPMTFPSFGSSDLGGTGSCSVYFFVWSTYGSKMRLP